MSTAGNIQSRLDDNEFAAGVLVDLKAHYCRSENPQISLSYAEGFAL